MDILTTTLRALHVAFFVFGKCKYDFKWLLAIFTVELIAGHMTSEKRQSRCASTARCTLRRCRCQGKQLSGSKRVPTLTFQSHCCQSGIREIEISGRAMCDVKAMVLM